MKSAQTILEEKGYIEQDEIQSILINLDEEVQDYFDVEDWPFHLWANYTQGDVPDDIFEKLGGDELLDQMTDKLNELANDYEKHPDFIANELLEACEADGIDYSETTSAANGYPKNVKRFFHGFNNFQDAEKFAETHSLEVCLFQKRAGEHFWQNKGYKNEPLTINDLVADLGDNYAIFDYDNDFAAFLERVAEAEDFETVENLYNSFVTLKDEHETLGENESVIRCLNNYYDTYENEMMSYEEDSKYYLIGVQ